MEEWWHLAVQWLLHDQYRGFWMQPEPQDVNGNL